MDNLDVGVVVGNHERAVYVNEAFCSLTGYSAEELLAMPTLVELLPPDARDGILARARRRLAGEAEPRHYETELVHRDGHSVPVELSAQVVQLDGEMEIVGLVRGIAARRRVDAELAYRARQQQAVAELGRRALVDCDVSALIDTAVEVVARTLDVEYTKVLELLPGGDAFLLRAGVGWRTGCVGHVMVGAGRDSQAGFTLATDAPVVVADVARETRFGIAPLLVEHGVKSGMTVIIRSQNGAFGVLGADSTRLRGFSDDDVHFLWAVANVLADAIARARIEAELATRARQQAAVVELGRRALVDRDVSALMEAAVDILARTLDVEYVKVLELLPGGEAFLLRAGVGWRTGCVGHVMVGAGRDSQAGFTLATDAPVGVEDLSRETRFHGPPLLVEHGVVSGMSVAVGVDRPWGVLSVHTSTRRLFSAEDTRFLQAIAHVLAEAIARAQVDDALRAAHDQERRLRQRLEAYARRAVEGQEVERRHIARELHDEVGQVLTGLMLNLENIERLPADVVGQRLERVRALVDELLHRVRTLSRDLRPALLDDLGLRPALLDLVERFTAQTGVEVALTHCGLDGRLLPDIEIAAYRIAQEALTNVARHAGVCRATLSCLLDRGTLLVEVTDDGVGFDPEAARDGPGTGVVGMEERARAAGGRLRVDARPGHGTRVVAELPVGDRPSPQP